MWTCGSFQSEKKLVSANCKSTNFKSANHNKDWVRKSQICKVPHLQKIRKSDKLVESANLRVCDLRNLIYVTDGNIMYLTDASRFLISCVIQHYAPVVGWRNRCIMLIMSLYPSWRQTLRMPPPGIEPGLPASQAGTLPKELSRQLTPISRIQDFYPRSRILIFSHPRSWIQNIKKREG